MPWFQKLCRQTGLILHQIAKPVEKPDTEARVIARRTTVTEEIEVRTGHTDVESHPQS